MKMKRILFGVLTTVLILAGCSVQDENGNDSFGDEPIHLDVTQANLISDVTNNIKYLNQDLLYNVTTLDDDDNLSVIITLDDSSIIDYYLANSLGYKTVGEFASSSYGKTIASRMSIDQERLAKKLINDGLIEDVKHSYTTLMNGFAANITYGQYKKLGKMDYVYSDLVLCEAYALPKTYSANLSSSSDDSTSAIENIVDVYETGIFDTSDIPYTGNNTAVAILDSGFDVHHEVFKTMPSQPLYDKSHVEEVLDSTAAYGFSHGLKVGDVYLNAKIPYHYDYADKDPDVAPFDSNHGTHVAGIIGGQSDVITGVAIETQLVLMKVFGDTNNGALSEDIMAALEDAVLLGVDAINLSLGTSCGFSRASDNEYINTVYDKIEAAGTSMVVAASNDYSSAYGGEESNTNKTSNPDSGTVGSPGTYTTSLSVASISGVKSKYITTDDGYVFFFNDANSAGTESYDFYEMIYNRVEVEEGEDLVLDYVVVPGYGKPVNYSNIDVKGKVALVRRGETTFEEKSQAAYDAGAIACIVYNNIGGDIYMSAGNYLNIPFCSISKDDGEYLANKGNGKLIFNSNNLAGPFMSDFSSWGPNPDLTLKPEITGHGGEILSSVPGGGYDIVSGTSMACPNVCGLVILIRQYIKEAYPQLNSVEVLRLANNLALSTSTIILDKTGDPYSPRKQGSGLANINACINTLAYLTVDGCDKAKIQLGDDKDETGSYTLSFNITNTSDQVLKYTLDDYTMTESVSTSDSRFVAEEAYILNPTTSIKVTGDGTNNGNVVSVNPNSTVTVTYQIDLSKSDIDYIHRSFENGMYVEGFITLDSLNEDNIDLSIPFLGFFGDWDVAPMFDKTFYEVQSEAYDKSIDPEDKLKADYYASTPLGTYYYDYVIPLGAYVYEMDETLYDMIPASEEHAAMSYYLDTINGITAVYAGLLRNAKKMTSVITNTVTGEVIYEHINYDQEKAHFSGSPIPSYDLIELTAYGLALENNVNYTFTMTGELDTPTGGVDSNINNTFSFSFYCDYEAPLITDCQFYTKYDKSEKITRYYVDVYVYDNHYTQSIRPFILADGNISVLSDYPIPVYGDRNSENKVTVEITDYMDYLQFGTGSNGMTIVNGLGFMVDDYALNDNYYFVALPGTNSDGFTFVDEDGEKVESTMAYVGEVIDLASMLVPNDPDFDPEDEDHIEYLRRLEWKSSNEDILRVHNGYAEGISKGTTYVTVTTTANNGYQYSKTIKVMVRTGAGISTSVEDDECLISNKELISNQTYGFNNDVSFEDIEFTYFDTLKAFASSGEYSDIGETGDRIFLAGRNSLSFYPSEKIKLAYEITPWNLDPSRYTLEWSSSNENVAVVSDEGVVQGISEGNATITLKIIVDGKQSNVMARLKVTIKNEFVVDGRTLVAYKGFGGDVVIPDDEGIMYIGSFAFSLYSLDYEVDVDEDNYDANKTPYGNDTITSVTIPYDIQEIQSYAFFNCPNLKKVTFIEGSKGDICSIVRAYAFAGCSSLTDINSEKLEVIGEGAFYGCSSLKTLDTSSIYAIGSYAFMNCTSLETIDITTLRNVGRDIFKNCFNLTSITSGEFTNFGEGMFENTALKEVTFYYDRIPNNLFKGCKSLERVTIVNDIVYLGSNVFNGCKSLEEVTFISGCEYIYKNAFDGCSNLEKITLPNSDVIIEANAFNGCTKLSTLVFNPNTYIKNDLANVFVGVDSLNTFIVDPANSNYQSVDNYLLTDNKTTIVLAPRNVDFGQYQIPDGIKMISSGAFSNNLSITKLTIPSSVEVIGTYAFSGCSNLEELTFLGSNVDVLAHAFADNTKLATINNIDAINEFSDYIFANTALTSIKINNNSVVGKYAFSGSKLTVAELGNNVVLNEGAFSLCLDLETVISGSELEVGDHAFNGCTKLATFDFNNVINKIGDYAFAGCSGLTHLEVGLVTHIGDYAFADAINVENVVATNVVTIGDFAFSTTLDTAVNANNLTSINFGDSLESIGNNAFYKNNKLNYVVIGHGLKHIGEYAFANCGNLTDVVILSDINTIGVAVFYEDVKLQTLVADNIEYVSDAAFYNCQALQNINLSKMIEVGMQSFYYCKSLNNLDLSSLVTTDAGSFLYAEGLVNFNMPVIEYIDEQAFSCIGAVEIILPESVKYIAPTAFYFNKQQESFGFVLDGVVTYSGQINGYAKLDNGVLYTVLPNGKYVLSSYPTNKLDTEYEVINGVVRIEAYSGAYNNNIEKIIFPETLELIGNMCFYNCNKLRTVEFKSTTAPTLEGTFADMEITYPEGTPIYDLMNDFFQLNGYAPLYYGQFVSMIGTCPLLSIIVPKNTTYEGYDSVLYSLYFDIENMTKSSYVAMDEYTISFLDKIKLVPENNINLNDKNVIEDARTAYSALRQDLTDFGYSKDDVNKMLEVLENAEEEFKNLMLERVGKKYDYLIEAINDLGPVYLYEKILDYYAINEILNNISDDEKKYIDTSNVESFKAGLNEYFRGLNEDIKEANSITSLSTLPVNKVGIGALVVTGSNLLAYGGYLLTILRKRLFLF